jgi:NTP pyrophosphatase (non-canonical NTP hydrolase)
VDKTEEILTIVQEECAEVIQIISKCRRFGINEKHIKSGLVNREYLTNEIGDLVAMIELMKEYSILDPIEIEKAKKQKIEKLKVWSGIFQ